MLKICASVVTFGLFITAAQGQGLEIGANLNSGLFSFGGRVAQSTTFINYSDPSNSGYTNNPYGSRGGISYGASGSLLVKTGGPFVFGADLGYEVLRSKVKINGVAGFTGSSSYAYDATGKTFLNCQFITIYPFAGYRIPAGFVSITPMAGVEVGYVLSIKEDGSITDVNGRKYETSLDRKTIKADVRPSVRVAVSHGKVGVYAGYSIGLIGYLTGYTGSENDVHSRMFRFGLSYRVK